MNVSDEIINAGKGVPVDKRFPRLHKAFHDAVRTRRKSAIVQVLLQAQLSGDLARRTADKILADQRRHA